MQSEKYTNNSQQDELKIVFNLEQNGIIVSY